MRGRRIIIKKFSAVRQNKTYVEIVEQIAGLISEGVLQPGEQLPPERTLAVELKTGRQCLREAFSALEVMGLIEVHPGRGAFVRETNEAKRFFTFYETDSPSEILEARKILEVKIVGLAAERATLEEIQELTEMVHRVELVEHDQPSEENLELHLAFARASHNAVLFKMMNDITECMRRTLWKNVKGRSLKIPGRRKEYHDQHREILQAIMDRDPVKAAEVMGRHLEGLEYDMQNLD